ncbi:hypothetical protein, partial [Bacteroides sp.]|uniref:hypothetical protein n=1 Tax=Bacteroides sp. TaxID=29523 RepID=UPI00261123F1
HAGGFNLRFFKERTQVVFQALGTLGSQLFVLLKAAFGGAVTGDFDATYTYQWIVKGSCDIAVQTIDFIDIVRKIVEDERFV